MAVQSEWLQKNYYDVLGVPQTATDHEISRAYRRLARELHPDVNPNNKEAEERFKEVSVAYDVLGDPAKRKEYDEARRLMQCGVGSGFGGAPFGGHGDGGFTVRIDDLADLDDLAGFSDVFGDLLFGRGRPGTKQRRRRGADLEAELALSFEEAVFGVTTDVDVNGKRVRVRIPPGVDNGQLIRVPGRGNPGRDGGPPGDLYVVVRVSPHPIFGRDGQHLTVTLPITYPEAVLGAEVKVPTLDGSPVTIRIPSGTPSGKTFRVRGHGIPRASGRRGDLLAAVEVAVPQRATVKERKAVEALAKVTSSPRAHLGV